MEIRFERSLIITACSRNLISMLVRWRASGPQAPHASRSDFHEMVALPRGVERNTPSIDSASDDTGSSVEVSSRVEARSAGPLPAVASLVTFRKRSLRSHIAAARGWRSQPFDQNLWLPSATVPLRLAVSPPRADRPLRGHFTTPHAAPVESASTRSPWSRVRPKVGSAGSVSARAANTVRFGGAKFGWLSRLNTSIRSSTRPASPSRPQRMLFRRDMSTVCRSGPLKSPRPVLPNVPAGGMTKAVGSNHCIRPPQDGVIGGATRRVARAIRADAGAERGRPLRPRSVRRRKGGERAVRCARSRCPTPASRSGWQPTSPGGARPTGSPT